MEKEDSFLFDFLPEKSSIFAESGLLLGTASMSRFSENFLREILYHLPLFPKLQIFG